ncbi:MarR family winged helix-turn-helix transcriptional regulator [Streptomyces sp. NBC_00083]|uniref:MarR family winged helix-turn-helix transcriptional regulator n=1 Tax=Streptomyces sp. NBC_00083 TaxID=2975647 RepID=UPI00224D10CE|nr:MarR family transcriptional regulator [Streptomyces sp. NBC_00083]MCX5387425.1 MarR family transcriptional regulator [Streptomyces sp. NBC_00083]
MADAATGAERTSTPPEGPQIGGPASWALRQVLLANRDAELALARHLGLGPNDVTAMEHLLAAPDGLGPIDIAHRLGIRSASATVLVDRLQEAGHVTRAPHHTDRRRTVVKPTPRARDEIIAALTPLIGAVENAASALSEDELATVVNFLNQAAAHIKEQAERLESPPRR